MIIYTIRERDDWFICSRKPIICPRCQKREVRLSIFGMPTQEARRLARRDKNIIND